MNDTDLAFLSDIFPIEHQRIRLLYERDGFQSTYLWVLRTYKVYRDTITFRTRNRSLASWQRYQLLIACIEFRLFLKLYRKTVDFDTNVV